MRYCVIMCGGIGSRFWPYSRHKMPKQFLDFFGTGRSLLQMTFDRIRPVVPVENIILMTNSQYADLIREQLPEIPAENVLCEPARRNTAPCLCWAAHHIKARDPEASMVVLASDHLILREDCFREDVVAGLEYVEQTGHLLTFGILPTSPHTGYGYIQATISCDDYPEIKKVKSFTEKPDEAMAKLFVESGEFYWNSGMFLWTAKSILEAYAEYSPEVASVFDVDDAVYAGKDETEFIDNVYSSAQSISVDYAIMEKAPNVYVKIVDFGWSDLGTWKALYEISPRNAEGNVTQNCNVLAQNCTGTLFAVSDEKIVVADGLHDYIVAERDNALLIYPIDKEQHIRHIVNDIKNLYGEKYE